MKKVVTGIAIGVVVTLAVVYVPRFIIPVTETPEGTESPGPTRTYVRIDGKIVVGGDGEPVELVNNPSATNPTYAELLAFLEADQTDKFTYILGPPKNAYVCADFARDVHNNAEAAGIRAAWVAITFEGRTERHAINAFETTDVGLVYIDCTGKGLWDESTRRNSWDRRARPEIGKLYAVADIGKAKTRFYFYVITPIHAERLPGLSPMVLHEQTLSSLEALGWIRIDNYEQRVQKSAELSEWERRHDIEVLKQMWWEEWMRQHEVNLANCGQEFELQRKHGCYVELDCLETPWFQPEEELRQVDGIPLVWKVRKGEDWEVGWHERLGVVKGIDIHW